MYCSESSSSRSSHTYLQGFCPSFGTYLVSNGGQIFFRAEPFPPKGSGPNPSLVEDGADAVKGNGVGGLAA